MPNFVCKCNYLMNLSDGGNSYEFSLILEKKINKIIGVLETNKNKINVDDFIDEIDSQGISVLKCPECGRFWLDSGDGSYNAYIKEIE